MKSLCVCILRYAFLLNIVISLLNIKFVASRNFGDEDSLEKVINRRVDVLKSVSNYLSPSLPCYNESYIAVQSGFGNIGNNMIELASGLWLSKLTNSTFIFPAWIEQLDEFFELSFLQQNFCIERSLKNVPRRKVNFYETSAEDYFFAYRILEKGVFANVKMPLWSRQTVVDLSKTLISVYAGIWSHVRVNIMDAAIYLMKKQLGNNFLYTTVHKRNLDGECNGILNEVLSKSYLESKGIAIDTSDVMKEGAHPLCEMRLSFVDKLISQTAQNINSKSSFSSSENENHHYHGHNHVHSHNRSHGRDFGFGTTTWNHSFQTHPIFLSYDGDGNIDDYISQKAILSSDLPSKYINSVGKKALRYVDMLIAMHGDLFVLNPRSTFSFQVFVIRSILGLDSLPIFEDRDVYCKTYSLQELRQCQFKEDYPHSQSFWISWLSVEESISQTIHQLFSTQIT